MLLFAHCCKASLKICWDRRCANSKTTISGFEGSFTSSLITEGILGRNLSSDIKLSALACRSSLSIVVGNGKVCFDFMQPMLWRALTEFKQRRSNDYLTASLVNTEHLSTWYWPVLFLSRPLQCSLSPLFKHSIYLSREEKFYFEHTECKILYKHAT